MKGIWSALHSKPVQYMSFESECNHTLNSFFLENLPDFSVQSVLLDR